MKPTIYKFDLRKNILRHERWGEFINSRDYWQWYTTGIENLAFNNKDDYFMTSRHDNERSEVITYKMFGKENLSDLVLAINNDVYLWDAPLDYDTQDAVVRNKMAMIEYHRKVPFRNEEQANYYYDRFKNKMDEQNIVQRQIILPKYADIQRVIRRMRNFLDNRKVF